jgi:hypothetical protein
MKNKFIMLLLALIAGVIIGAAIVWMIFNCCCQRGCGTGQNDNPPPLPPGVQLISVSTANNYFKAYLNSPISVDTLKAFSINADQFAAMKLIEASDTTVHGFRIYMGVDGQNPVRIVVGTGSPDKTNLIYATDDAGSAPCPYLCDDSSPIMDK